VISDQRGMRARVFANIHDLSSSPWAVEYRLASIKLKPFRLLEADLAA